LTAVRNLQQRDEMHDQEIALHETQMAGIGADDAPSDPEPEDDSEKPYRSHPLIDDAAKEGEDDEDLDDGDYNTSAGYNDTKDDTEDDKTNLDSSLDLGSGISLGTFSLPADSDITIEDYCETEDNYKFEIQSDVDNELEGEALLLGQNLSSL
jgi:hypothetical protein